MNVGADAQTEPVVYTQESRFPFSLIVRYIVVAETHKKLLSTLDALFASYPPSVYETKFFDPMDIGNGCWKARGYRRMLNGAKPNG